jgi:hypothetical protein
VPSSAVVELSDEAHRFLFTVAQAASDAVCGFLPASVSSPVSTPSVALKPRARPGINIPPGSGQHTRNLIEALPPTVTIQMVDMSAMKVNLPIKAEFMETFNSIYNPPPPPLMPMGPSDAGLPPLEPTDPVPVFNGVELPPLEEYDPALIELGEGEEDWDFASALDFIFESDKASGPVSGSEWFTTNKHSSGALALGGSGSGGNGEASGGQLLVEENEDLAPIKFFYNDALQRCVQGRGGAACCIGVGR